MKALYTVHKVIYYDYAWRFKIVDLYDLIESTFKDRWNLHLSRHWFRLLVNTQRYRPLSPADCSPSPFEPLIQMNMWQTFCTESSRAGNPINTVPAIAFATQMRNTQLTWLNLSASPALLTGNAEDLQHSLQRDLVKKFCASI